MQASKIFQVASSSEKKPPRFIFQASAAAHVYLSLPPSPCASAHEKYKFAVFVETVTPAREKQTNKQTGILDLVSVMGLCQRDVLAQTHCLRCCGTDMYCEL